MSIGKEALELTGATGARIAAVLHHPEGEPIGSVLAAPCFTCGKDIATMTRLARGLASAGYATLRLDFTGLGDSGGDFAETNLTTNVEDVHAALALLGDRGLEPIAMVGHSMGGAACLLAALDAPEVTAVALLATPSRADHLRRNLPEVEATRDRDIDVEIAGRRLTLGRGFLDDLERHDLTGAAARLGRPLLILHGSADELVGVEEAEALHEAASGAAELVLLPGADHLLTDRADADAAIAAIAGWLERSGRR